MGSNQVGVFLLILCLLWRNCVCWGWFGSPSAQPTEKPSDGETLFTGFMAEFSMESHNNPKGIEKVENAKKKLSGSNSCWVDAYQSLFSGCSEILNNNEKRQRLAWHLTDCFQKDSGGLPFPSCGSRASMKDCLGTLKEDARRTYLEFYLETSSICQELQAHTFRRQTERLVNDLKKSAEFAEEKIEKIEESSEHLLQRAKEIRESLATIDLRTQQVAQSSKIVEDSIEAVLKHSEAVFEQSKGIASSQLMLQEGQAQMKDKLEEEMATIHDSYNSLSQEIDSLRNEAVEIEKDINKVGNIMSSKMENLQIKANDIGNMAGVSLDKQKELLDGQSVALEGLQFLTNFQSQALEESRVTLQKLAEFSQKQQEELLVRQEHLQRAHDHLVQSSKTIIEAQEAFESKQASMFSALEKLFTLHNAMLMESRLIKSFFVYSISIFIIYMVTSTKQTYTVRPKLYIGLSTALVIECIILRHGPDDIEQMLWIINLVRSLFVLLASLQLVHAIFTYRDYEVLNHRMLLSLIDKVNGMQRNRELCWQMEDSDVDWSTWINSDVVEDVDDLQDPDFALPEHVENTIAAPAVSRPYNLRHR